MSGSDFMFNIARARSRQLYENVKTNNPANSAIIAVPLESTSIEADATLRDYDDLASLLAGTSNEQTTAGRKTLTDADLAAVPAPDDTNDRLDLDLPDLSYPSLSGNAIGKIIYCYDPDTTTGTDSSLIPMWAQAVTINPDGNNVQVVMNAAGVYRSN